MNPCHTIRMSQHRLGSAQTGFTLIEVLVAMALLSFGLLSVAGMQVVAIQVNKSSQQLNRATTLIEDKVEELMALPFNHASLADATPVGISQSYTATNLPPGYSLGWRVDANADNTSKTVTVIGRSAPSRPEMKFAFTKTIFQ